MHARLPPGLLTLVRLWLIRATGIVHGSDATITVPLRRGGVVDAADVPVLRRLVSTGAQIQLDHYPINGEFDRAVVAALIGEVARSRLRGHAAGGVIEARPLVAVASLVELGLGVLKVDGDLVHLQEDDLALAMKGLGLFRATRRIADPPAPAARPGPDVDREPPPPPPPRRGPSTLSDEWKEEGLSLDLDQLVELEPEATIDVDLDEARSLIDRGAYHEAERELVRLRDLRLDDWRVLYLLVEARIGACHVVDDPTELELERWLHLANLLGGAGEARARAERAMRSAARADAPTIS
jgi:hypothetical protein